MVPHRSMKAADRMVTTFPQHDGRLLLRLNYLALSTIVPLEYRTTVSSTIDLRVKSISPVLSPVLPTIPTGGRYEKTVFSDGFTSSLARFASGTVVVCKNNTRVLGRRHVN